MAPRTVCVADVAYECDGENVEATSSINCAADGRACAEGRGCLTCVPNVVRCDGETIEVCRADGSGYTRGETCDAAAGLRCSPRGCMDLCADAAATESYLGCEYTPVTLANSQIDDAFPFAVALANPQLVPAIVTIEGGRLTEPRNVTIAPGELSVVELPWVPALRGPPTGGGSSVLVEGAAYWVRSDVPIAASQFNPLPYRRGESCTTRDCYSFTNDASLLLPTHVLTGSYLAMSRPSQLLRLDDMPIGGSGFVAIVAIDETVEFDVRTRTPTIAGSGAPALVPGVSAHFTLHRGDVLQLLSERPTECTGVSHSESRGDGLVVTYCDLGPDFDLTGTEIRSNGHLAVFSGHDCSFVPYDRWACDHLEEQIFPVEALGPDLFLPVTRPLRAGEPNIVRVVSAADGNIVRFEPPLDPTLPDETRLLDRGDFFEVELREPHWVRGTGPLLAALFLVGQDYGGLGSAGSLAVGDPAMALAIPNAQFRAEYTFLSPATYATSAADLVAPMSARIEVDGRFVPLTAVAGTTMGTAHLDLMPGVHRASGNIGFGVYVSGFGSYTSYFVPGGMDFIPITPPF
jgi:hypothetical protein